MFGGSLLCFYVSIMYSVLQCTIWYQTILYGFVGQIRPFNMFKIAYSHLYIMIFD